MTLASNLHSLCKKKLANNFISITTIKKQTCLLMWVLTMQLERGRERERKRHTLPEGGGAMTWSHASIDAHVRGLFS